MIAGFEPTPTQERALNEIILAEEKIAWSSADMTEAQSLLAQAKQAYFNCEYDEAYDLSQQGLRNIPILLPSIPWWVWIALSTILIGILYWYASLKKKIKLTSIRKSTKIRKTK